MKDRELSLSSYKYKNENQTKIRSELFTGKIGSQAHHEGTGTIRGTRMYSPKKVSDGCRQR